VRYATYMAPVQLRDTRQHWIEFLEAVALAREELGSPDTVWYRGHSDADWSLLPTIFRIPDGLKREQQAFHEFKRLASKLFAKHENDWEVLFDMQHYGIPTRLLDWTESLGVAIAFITFTQYYGDRDSALFVLNPATLNASSGLADIKRLPDDLEFQYRRIYWDKKPFAPHLPIAAYPPLRSERLFAQLGVFTIHGDDSAAVENVMLLSGQESYPPSSSESGCTRVR